MIHPGALRMGQQRMRVLLTQDGRTRAAGTATEVLGIENDRGAPLLRRMQTLDSRELGMVRAEVLMSPTTLAPVRAQSAGLLGASALRYDLEGVYGSVTPAGGIRSEVDLPLDAPVFDGYAVELILRALPLEAGYQVTIPAYVHRAGAVVPVAVRVEAREEYAGQAAWRVSADFGRLRATYWIAHESRTLLRQDTLLSSGTTLTFVR
jgi:hypothetical protein